MGLLASVVASKAARLMTACVCPVVGVGTLTMTVPPIKKAVHEATAPRQYALPKTRQAPDAAQLAAAPCEVPVTSIAHGFSEGLRPDASSLPLFQAAAPGGGGGLPPGGGGGGGPLPPSPTSPVPEPYAWLQLIVGFGLVGGAVRMARRRPDEQDAELLDRLADVNPDGDR